MDLAMKLESHFHDMQDMEFTIEEGKLYFLQTRNGKRTAPAAIQIACDPPNSKVFASSSILISPQPDTQQVPIPRATTAA